MQEDIVALSALRGNMAHAINRAAYGSKPVIVTRRGMKVAAIISMSDLVLLVRMRRKRDEILARELPEDPLKIGAAIAQLFKDEMDFF